MAIALDDNFSGAAGSITGHTADTGQTWQDNHYTGEDCRLDGAGRLVSSPQPGTGIDIQTVERGIPINEAVSVVIGVNFTAVPATANFSWYVQATLYDADADKFLFYSFVYQPGGAAQVTVTTSDGDFSSSNIATAVTFTAGPHDIRFDTDATGTRFYFDDVLKNTFPAEVVNAGANNAFLQLNGFWTDTVALPNPLPIINSVTVDAEGFEPPPVVHFWTRLVGSSVQ